MKTFAKLMVILSVAIPVAAVAEPVPKQVADMECLVGSWKGDGSLVMGKDSAKINATWTCKRTSARFGVLCTFHVTGMPGGGVYEETDLMGYEPNTNTYHWYSVTNAGETHDHIAPVSNGNTIQFVFKGTQEGKPLKEVIDLAFSNNSKDVSGRAETFVADVSASVMQLKLHK